MAELESKTIHSVAKAIRLLDLLAERTKPATLTELYQATGWPKSTIHGLLSTMREAGLIEQMPNGRYWLGIRLFEYGCAVSNAWDIGAIARPQMQKICAERGESVFLSVFDRAAVVTLAEEESRASLRVVSEVGARLPLHCTSQGNCFWLIFHRQSAAGSCPFLSSSPIRPIRSLPLSSSSPSFRRSASRATPWKTGSSRSVCALFPRRCVTRPERCATPSAWSVCSGRSIQRISSWRRVWSARRAASFPAPSATGHRRLAQFKNFFRKNEKMLDILSFTHYNQSCCLSCWYSSVGRAADL